MNYATPTSLPSRILACLHAHGEQSGREIAEHLGMRYERHLRVCLSNLAALSRINVKAKQFGGINGCAPRLYSLPQPWIVPKMTPGEWVPWHPTGSVPSEVRRLVIQQEA